MMSVIARYAFVLLGAACVGQGYYIHARRAELPSPARDLQARHEQWASDIESLKKLMTPAQQQEAEALQGQAFEEWFQAKVAVSGIKSDVKVTDDQVIVTFKVPGLKAETLRIAISDVLIRANYSARSFVEDKNAQGAYRSEAVRQFETIMPVPSNADASKHKLFPEAEGFKIIFEKREDPTLKS